MPPNTNTEAVIVLTLSETNTPMAFMTSPRKIPVTGCLSKLIIILFLILGSGTLGWFVGKAWISQVTEDNQEENIKVFSEKSPENDVSSISDEELKRKNDLRLRRRNLGFNHRLFVALVDERFSEQYPSQKGRTLSSKPEDASWREKWDQIATNLLDTLESLEQEVVQGMGTYTASDRNRWKQQVNNLHLSSRALYNLVDARFFQAFPEQENQSFIDKPVGQVWHGMILDTLQDLQSGASYEKLSFTDEEFGIVRREATLNPGGGKAYVIRLDASSNMEFKLEGNRDILLSIYSPTGNNNLLENSQRHQWSGKLPETGYYEFIIVSPSEKPVNYRFQLRVNQSDFL